MTRCGQRLLYAAVLAVGLGAPAVLHADTHYVALSGRHLPPFTNWMDAATNIQTAVNWASDRDEVLVAAGTYCVTSQIVVTQGVAVSSVDGPDMTIVDGMSTTWRNWGWRNWGRIFTFHNALMRQAGECAK